MVTVIKTGYSIKKAFVYNEKKVKEKAAELLLCANYFGKPESLGFSAKLSRLEKQAALADHVERNSVHISINFDPSDTISNIDAKAIAEKYMHEIGFGEQPYLVYRHYDAGHPHLHVVTTSIRSDGNKIDMFNIGKFQSAKARELLENEYGLVKAKGRKIADKLAPARLVTYGKTETRRAIANVLSHVLNKYAFTSLTTLNAVLGLYNVRAHDGGDGSRIKRTGGLVYQVLDATGKPVGVPIKASLFTDNPGLKKINTLAVKNAKTLQGKTRSLKNEIDFYFLQNRSPSFNQLIAQLKRNGIDTVERRSDTGKLYGITFVDHKNCCSVNGSQLGKNYSAAALLERSSSTAKSVSKREINESQMFPATVDAAPDETRSGLAETLIADLMTPENQSDYIDPNLKKKKRKRKA